MVLVQLDSANFIEPMRKPAQIEKRLIDVANDSDKNELLWFILGQKYQEIMKARRMRFGQGRNQMMIFDRFTRPPTVRTTIPANYATLPYDFFPRFG